MKSKMLIDATLFADLVQPKRGDGQERLASVSLGKRTPSPNERCTDVVMLEKQSFHLRAVRGAFPRQEKHLLFVQVIEDGSLELAPPRLERVASIADDVLELDGDAPERRVRAGE